MGGFGDFDTILVCVFCFSIWVCGFILVILWIGCVFAFAMRFVGLMCGLCAVWVLGGLHVCEFLWWVCLMVVV